MLGDGRQLLVITYEDKLLDGILLIVAGRQDTDQIRFENLRSFVNNSQVEPLEVEEMQAVIDGRRRTYKDTCAADFFLDVCQFGTVFQAVFQQVGSKPSVTRQFMPDPDERSFLAIPESISMLQISSTARLVYDSRRMDVSGSVSASSTM